MSDYDQYVPKSGAAGTPSSGNEYEQYVKKLGTGPAPALGGAPGFGSGGFGAVQKAVDHAGKNATKTVGRAIVAGHKDPLGSLMNGLESTQRFTHAGELDALGGQHIDPIKAFMDPKMGPGLKRQVDMGAGMNKGGVFDQMFAGTDLPHKLMRAGGHTAFDAVNDIGSFLPLGKVGSVVKDVVPGVKPATEFLGRKLAESPAGALLNPDHHLRGLTNDAKAKYDVIVNKAQEAARQANDARSAIVKKHAAQIRLGDMPDEVAALFPSTVGTGLKDIARPGAPIDALNRPTAAAARPGPTLARADINARPSGVARGASVTPTVESPGGSIRPGTTASKDVSRGAKVSAKAPPPELAPTIRPGGVRDVRVDSATVPQASSLRRPPDIARSQAGQSTLDAWKPHFTDEETGKLEFGPGTRPQDVARKLAASHAAETQAQIEKELTDAGFFQSPESIRASSKPSLFDRPADEVAAVQNRLRKNIAPKPDSDNAFLNAARTLTHRGNQAFLANPVPHVGNLTNLAYNEYGAPTAIKGLINGARVAMGKTGGKLGENINELESLGAKSQYGNIFDEMGLTRLAGIPGTEGAARAANRVLVPLQRASNAAQHKILNSAETGLRSAALDAERAGGTTGAQAAKHIHSTFGTDAPNRLSQAGTAIGAPFFKFHGQTAPASVLKTLAKNPGRISNTLKAEQDYNAQVNPHGPKYHSTVPGANAQRMLMDPLGYFGSLGPIEQLGSPNGLIEQLKKGPKGVERVLGENAGRFIPQSEEISALAELLKHKKNARSKATGVQDLSSSLFGGYYGK